MTDNGPVSQQDIDNLKKEIELNFIEKETRAVPIFVNLFTNFRNEGWISDKFRASIQSVIWYLLSPRHAVTISVIFSSIATLTLAWQSNSILRDQNRLITIQNQLQESARRAGLTVELTEVLNRISDEQKGKNSHENQILEKECNQEKYNYNFPISPIYGQKPTELSGALLGRVVALSKSFRPYRFLDVGRDSLGRNSETGLSELSSPERSQLLMALASSNISIEQLSRSGAEFDLAPLANVVVSGLSLRNLIANSVDWNGAILVYTDLSKSQLRWSKLTEANATCANFDGADLRGTDLSDGQFLGASFREANLQGVNLSIVKLNDAKLQGADLRGAYVCDTNNKPIRINSVDDFKKEISSDSFIIDNRTKFGKVEGLGAPKCPE